MLRSRSLAAEEVFMPLHLAPSEEVDLIVGLIALPIEIYPAFANTGLVGLLRLPRDDVSLARFQKCAREACGRKAPLMRRNFIGASESRCKAEHRSFFEACLQRRFVLARTHSAFFFLN